MPTPSPQTKSPIMDLERTNSTPSDAVEAEVQRILSELERASSEVQAAVFTRLLAGLALKLPNNVPAKVIAAAKENQETNQKITAGRRATNRGKDTGSDFARIDSQLSLLTDPTDPILAWERFGQTGPSLRNILLQEPLGALEGMLRHDHMPPGAKPRTKSRKVLVDNIIQRLEDYYHPAE